TDEEPPQAALKARMRQVVGTFGDIMKLMIIISDSPMIFRAPASMLVVIVIEMFADTVQDNSPARLDPLSSRRLASTS
ncbi:3437_t:CDS:2, partial [Acaulospora colombiana]